jgi:hypothetical protein
MLKRQHASFSGSNRKLAVFSHYTTNVDPPTALRLVRESYTGQVEFGEDSIAIP